MSYFPPVVNDCASDFLEPCETGCLAKVEVQHDQHGRPRLMECIGCRHAPQPCELIWAEHTPEECRSRRADLKAVEASIMGRKP